MIGLAYLAVGGVYLALTVWLTRRAAQAATRRGIAGWKWGLPVVLAMYLLVFWDWIPTVIAHKYYCSKYAGFTVYKTLEQWKAENPGVAETLTTDKDAEWSRKGKSNLFHLNQRFVWEVRHRSLPLGLSMRIDEIRDTKADQVLAEEVMISTGAGNIALGAESLRDYKFWLDRRCDSSSGTFGLDHPKAFGEFSLMVMDIGSEED